MGFFCSNVTILIIYCGEGTILMQDINKGIWVWAIVELFVLSL